MFFDKEVNLNLYELVIAHDSFKNIMEDGQVTDEEIVTQTQKIIGILRDMEGRYSKEELAEIKELLVEMSVLYAAYNIYSIQNINKGYGDI